MNKYVNKAAPLGVMTACTIWCCWSQLRESTPLLAATEAKLPRIERQWLAPDMSAVVERDPFQQYKPEPTVVETEIVAQAVVPEEPSFDPQTVLPSIRLDATILGRRRLAVISGKIHGEGESVVLADTPDVQIQLVRILRDEVVIAIEGEEFNITYSHKAKTAAADEAPEAPSEPGEQIEDELPEGTPSPDELDQAVAEALANQPAATGDEDIPNADQTGDSPTTASHTEEDCEFDNDLMITDKLYESLNHDE